MHIHLSADRELEEEKNKIRDPTSSEDDLCHILLPQPVSVIGAQKSRLCSL